MLALYANGCQVIYNEIFNVHKIINFVKLNNPVPGQSFHGQGGCPMSIMLTCITLFVIFRKRKLSEDKLFFQGSRLDKIVF
jgi:hypothetical protein